MKFLDILKQDLQNIKQDLIFYDEIKIKSTKKYVVLTNEYLWIYSLNGKKKKGRFLIFLTGISYDKNSASLHFNQKIYQFFPKNLDLFLRSFFDIIQRILLPSELDKLYFKVLKTFIAWPNPLSIFSRIDQKVKVQNIKVDENFVNKFIMSLTFSKPIINLNKYPCNFIPILCDSIPISSTIREIIISHQNDISPFLLLSNIMKEPNRIRRIEVKGELINFPSLISSIKNNKNNKLFTLSFDSSKMRESDLQVLKPLYENKTLKGLELHNALSKSLEATFYTRISQFQLTILNLDGTKNINIHKLFPQLPEVMILSLSNCDINILNALQKLSLLPKLRKINLSNNFCDITISHFTTLPSKLRRIEVNKVRWMEGSLVSFFECISNIKEVSISFIDTEELEWNNLFALMKTLKNSSLEELIWDGNKTSDEFFSFIKGCMALSSLSLNYIYTFNDKLNFDLLLKFFDEYNKPFRKFCIQGDKNTFLGLESVHLIQSLNKNNIYIDCFDISYQQGGDQLIYEICTIMSNFKRIFCDGQNLIFAETINRLYRIATQEALPLSRGNHPIRNYPQNKVLVSFPYKDFQRVAERENWTNSEKDRFLHDFMVSSSRPPSQPHDIMYLPIDSKFDQPCMIYRASPKFESRFPRTLGKKEIIELSQQTFEHNRQRSSRKIRQSSIKLDMTNIIVHDEDEKYSKRITRSKTSKLNLINEKRQSIPAMKEPNTIEIIDILEKAENSPTKPPKINSPTQIMCASRKRRTKPNLNRKSSPKNDLNNEVAKRAINEGTKQKRRQSYKRRSKSPLRDDANIKRSDPNLIKRTEDLDKRSNETSKNSARRSIKRSSKEISKNTPQRKVLKRNVIGKKQHSIKLTTSRQLRKIKPPRIFNSEVSDNIEEKNANQNKIKIILSSSDSYSEFNQ